MILRVTYSQDIEFYADIYYVLVRKQIEFCLSV